VPHRKADVVQGTLDMLVLKTLSLGPRHGLGITERIAQLTRGTFQVKPGSLFPALYRMEREGWVKGEWGESENKRRARYYRLTSAGRRQLRLEQTSWNEAVLAISRVLEAPSR
jgi:PadR family transcriptional regulator PadR